MKTLAIIALALLGSTSARAYDIPVELGGFAGGHIMSPSSRLGWRADQPHALDSSGAFGFRFGLQFHPRIQLESELLLTPTQVTDRGDSVLVFGWRAHALVHILTGRVRPFIVVGGGGLTSSSSNPDLIREDTRGELHAGVGLKVDIQCHWGARVDTRVQFEQARDGGVYFTEDWEIIAGLYGIFGKSITAKCHK